MTNNKPAKIDFDRDDVITVERDADSIMFAQPTKIFIGTCPECTLPSRVEPQCDAVKAGVATLSYNCLHCNAFMTIKRLWATETEGSCDLRCMAATGDTCECACGGSNHAGAYRFNRFKSEETEEYIQRLLKQREKTEERRARREERKREAAAAEFNEWREALNDEDRAMIEWISELDNVSPLGMFMLDMRLRMMPDPNNPVKRPARPLTDNMMNACRKILASVRQREEREAEERANAKPAPEGRYRVHGEIVSRRIDSEEGPYGRTLTSFKILVKCDGYKLWGSCPADLVEDLFNPADMPRGLFAEFNATVKRSDDDESFAFFKNPRSAKFSTPQKRVSEPQNVEETRPSTDPETASEKRSAPRSGSHADCTHEATKSARARCRRERSQAQK